MMEDENVKNIYKFMILRKERGPLSPLFILRFIVLPKFTKKPTVQKCEKLSKAVSYTTHRGLLLSVLPTIMGIPMG